MSDPQTTNQPQQPQEGQQQQQPQGGQQQQQDVNPGLIPQGNQQQPQEGQQDQQQPQEGQRPEWLPEKFNDPAELAKAYQELESKLGKPPEEPVDFQAIQQSLIRGEEINDSQKAALEKAGIPESFFQQWAEGQRALVSQQTNEVLNVVGGKESYEAMMQWAAQNLGKEEQAAYNKIMETNDIHQIKTVVQGLQARYAAAKGHEPNLFNGRPAPASSYGFQSQGEMLAAMKDPRYKSDSRYREDVAARVANSKFF